jgi:hypothetical protein
MDIPKQDWQPVAMISDRSANKGGMETVARQLTSSAKLATSRTAAGASSVLDFGGPGGSALPSVLATGSPLSTFQYTLSRADRLALYRYFSKTDPFVGRALELHSELPMSRLTIGPPKGPSPRQNKDINRIYESMCERLDLLSLLLEFSREYWLAGDVYLWLEWNDTLLEWDDIYILPVEYCHSILHPFNRRKEIVFFARPLVDTAAIRRITDRDLYLVADAEIERLYEALGDEVPEELREALQYGEAVPLNTNWRNGSFCVHVPRNRPPNEEYGSSIIERCLETLMRLENLKNAQLQISSRNMNPKHVISALGVGETQLTDLRNQVDLSLLEGADYPIVTNYEVDWKTIGANDRLLTVSDEYNTLREDLATGLGTTKEMLTGQASYGGQRITLEMMNTQYLTFRELVRKVVEECIFRPVADAKGHYFREEIDMWPRVNPEDMEPGDVVTQEITGELRRKRIQVNVIWNHSSLRFNRLSIRDNAEVYDQLFQLHQKGSLPVRYLLDLHNIDPEESKVALLEDVGGPNDPVFNDLMRTMYTGSMAQSIVDSTDLSDRIIQNLKLQYRPAPQPAVPGSDMGIGMGGGGAPPMLGGDMSTPNPMGGPGGLSQFSMPTPDLGQPGASPSPSPDGQVGPPTNSPPGTPPPNGLPSASTRFSPKPQSSKSRIASSYQEEPSIPGIIVSAQAANYLRERAQKSVKPLTPTQVRRILIAAERKLNRPPSTRTKRTSAVRIKKN